MYKTIVIEHDGKFVAMGSILLRQAKGKSSVSGTMGQFMVNKEYPARAQLIHTLTFSLEQIAWAHSASYVLISPNDVFGKSEVVRELDYLRYYHNEPHFFYIKHR